MGQLILFLVTTFQTLWQPLMFKIFKVEDAKRIFSDIFTYLVWRFFGALAISIFSNELIAIFLQKVCPGKQHRANGGNDLCPFWFLLFSPNTPHIEKEALRNSFFKLFCRAVKYYFKFLLVPLLQIKGAIIATFITYLLLSVAMFVIAQRNYKIPYDYAGLVKILLSASVIFS